MPLLIELKSHEAWLMLETKSVHLLWLFWVNVKLIPNNVFNMLIYVKKIRSHFSLLFRIGFSIFLPHQSFVFQMTACNPCWHNNESMATWWIKFWRLNIFLLELGKLNKSCTYKRKDVVRRDEENRNMLCYKKIIYLPMGYFLYKTVSSGLILADAQRFRVVNSLSKHVSCP